MVVKGNRGFFFLGSIIWWLKPLPFDLGQMLSSVRNIAGFYPNDWDIATLASPDFEVKVFFNLEPSLSG